MSVLEMWRNRIRSTQKPEVPEEMRNKNAFFRVSKKYSGIKAVTDNVGFPKCHFKIKGECDIWKNLTPNDTEEPPHTVCNLQSSMGTDRTLEKATSPSWVSPML